MQRPVCKVLITDLDNTLWDWFDIWYSSFRPFLRSFGNKRNIRTRFEVTYSTRAPKYGTSEYSFS